MGRSLDRPGAAPARRFMDVWRRHRASARRQLRYSPLNMSTTGAGANFEGRLQRIAARTDAILKDLLTSDVLSGEIARPRHLLDAMRHGVLGGGKRIRPFLVAECAALFGADEANALHTGAAFELLHCYSLIHDDLPAMDDDDTRRGRPTVHRAFDEATAILAGDTLLTLAF